jgi:hypothetical protein
MMKLEDLQPGISLVGLEPAVVTAVVAIVPIADGTAQVIYKTPEGTIKERLLNRADEASISIATLERPWSFDGDGSEFQLACEAKRIDLAFLFDPMIAVHTSNVEPLPHQITAVYESMLPRQPLRYVLADDPGSGKTIMAGLYITECDMRGDAQRVLIVAPGSLVEQWRDELFEKFGLEFQIYSTALEQASPSGNPFNDYQRLAAVHERLSKEIAFWSDRWLKLKEDQEAGNRFLAEDDFDADTQFCLHWFEQYGWEAGKFGEADTLARAKGTSVEGVKQAGGAAGCRQQRAAAPLGRVSRRLGSAGRPAAAGLGGSALTDPRLPHRRRGRRGRRVCRGPVQSRARPATGLSPVHAVGAQELGRRRPRLQRSRHLVDRHRNGRGPRAGSSATDTV